MSRPRVDVVQRGRRWYSRYPAISPRTGKESTYWSVPEEVLDLTNKTRSKEQAKEIVAVLKSRAREGKTVYVPWYEYGQLLFEPPVVVIKAPSFTVADFLECYWEGKASAKKSRKVLRSQLNSVKKEVGSLVHKEVKDTDLLRWVEKLRLEKYTNKTIRVYVQMLLTACCYCYERKKLGGEDNKDIEHFSLEGILPKAEPRKEWFTEESFEKFYGFYRERNPPLALFFLGCYLTDSRLQEEAQYRWEWVREGPAFGAPNAPKGAVWRYIEVPSDINKEEQINNEVVIVDRLWDALMEAYPNKEDRVGLIYKNPEARSESKAFRAHYWNKWNKLLRKAFPGNWWENGADTLVFRDCRRSRNTNNMISGMPKETAKLITKHKSDACFQMYDGRDKRLLVMKSLHPEWFSSKPTESGQVEGEAPKLAIIGQ